MELIKITIFAHNFNQVFMKCYTYIFLIFFLVTSCKEKTKGNKKHWVEVPVDIEKLKGSYVWHFEVTQIKQTAIHTFYKDSIVFRMEGKVYSTLYTMKKLQCEKDKNKWIGKDKKDNFYAMFIKRPAKDQLIIYKKKCKTFQQAQDLALPKMDDKNNHGWNIYKKRI